MRNYFVLLPGLAFLAWTDYRYRKIPNRILVCLFIIKSLILIKESIIYREQSLGPILDSIFGFLIGGGILLPGYLFRGGGLRAGDIKLFAVIGCYLGYDSILTVLFLTFLFAALFIIIRICVKRIDLYKELPIAPFAFAGVIIFLFFKL